MKKTLLTIFAIGLAVSANAATISFTNLVGFDSTTNPIVSSTGVVIPDGTGFVAAGVFSITDAQILEFATSPGSIASAFTAVASGNFSSGINGLFSLAPTTNSSINSGTVYGIIGNASTFASSTEIGVFKFTQSFLADPAITDGAVLSNSASGNVSQILIGGFSNFTHDFGAGANSAYNLAVIPEPSAALLGALGVLGLLRRRRN